MYAGRLVEWGPVTPDLRRARPPVHPGAARLHPPHGRRRPRAPHRHRGPAPGPGRPAVRLRLPSPLPARDGPVPRADAARDRAGFAPHHALLALGPGAGSMTSTPILEAQNLTKHFPVKRGLFGQDARGGAGGGRRELLHRAGPDPGPGGRVGLRQDHHRQARAAAGGAHRRRHALRGAGDRRPRRQRRAAVPARGAGGVPGSVRLAQPAHAGGRHHRGAPGHPRAARRRARWPSGCAS